MYCTRGGYRFQSEPFDTDRNGYPGQAGRWSKGLGRSRTETRPDKFKMRVHDRHYGNFRPVRVEGSLDSLFLKWTRQRRRSPPTEEPTKLYKVYCVSLTCRMRGLRTYGWAIVSRLQESG